MRAPQGGDIQACRFAHPLFERFETTLGHYTLGHYTLGHYERDTIHPDEQPKDLGDADVLIFGMGRTGSAAYAQAEDQGLRPVGLDADQDTAAAHQEAGRKVLFADAEDSNI